MNDAQTARRPAIAQGPPLLLAAGSATSVAAALADRVARWPDGRIWTFGLNGDHREQSYRELWRRSGAIAAGLRKFCPAGATVVLLIDDAVDFAPAFWACIRGGFTAVPLMSAAREAFHQRGAQSLRQALSRLSNVNIIADDKFAEFAALLRHERGLPSLSLTEAESESEDDAAAAPAADPIYLTPTSGSTGGLKLVAVQESTVLYRVFTADFKQDQKGLGTFALDSITATIGVFLRGGSWTQMSAAALTIRPTSVLDAIEQHQITTVSSTNSTLKTVIAAAEQTERRWNLGSLLQVGLGGETVVPKVVQRVARFLERHGASRDIIRAGYGTTETGVLVTGANPLERAIDGDGAVRLGGCAPGVGLRVAGTDGELLAEGEIGELQVNCPQKVFSCYWGEPEATRQSFTADGWWRTGDLGRLQDGQLSLHGRTKELLVVSGKKFSLAEIDAEIETVLAAGDRAFACAIHWPEEATERLAVVFVAADPRPEHQAELVENIRAVVARRFGIRPNPISAASLDQIPLGANGKIRRSELGARVMSGSIVATELPPPSAPAVAAPAADETADLEERLMRVWREVLDVTGDLDKDATFFDLGGDSLRSVMLHTTIEERFGKRIAPDALFASPTFRNLLRLVAQHDGKAIAKVSEPRAPWALPQDLHNNLLMRFGTWGGERRTRDRLVAGLNTGGSKTPLFCVFQQMAEFRQLAKYLGPDQPLYGFRSGESFLQYSEDEIQMLALRYVAEITEMYPEGPLFVGGVCQGAIIAVAMAQHLLRRNRHVPLLTLLAWGFPLQPYHGPVLLVHGRDDIYSNPYLRFRRPELAWRRVFPDYAIAEMPGGHSYLFDDDNVAVLAQILASHMQKAERSLPRLVPKLAHRVHLIAELPNTMIAGDRRRISVRVRNASNFVWPEWKKSGLALGNRWHDEAGQAVVPIDGRMPLPELAAGAEARLRLSITAPQMTGAMQLSLDVVEEGNSWFNLPRNAPLRARVEILPQEKTGRRDAIGSIMKLWSKALAQSFSLASRQR